MPIAVASTGSLRQMQLEREKEEIEATRARMAEQIMFASKN